MTLDNSTINFHLENLLSSLSSYKSNEKELLSIIKVLEELSKDKRRMQKIISEEKKNSQGVLAKLDIEKIIINIEEKITNSEHKKLSELLRKNGKIWKM